MSTRVIYDPLPAGETELAVPSDYIKAEFIKVYSRPHVDDTTQVIFEGTLLVEGTDYTWLTSNLIQLTSPADGVTDYLVQRETQTDPIVQQQPGVYSSSKANLAVRQPLDRIEELEDHFDDLALEQDNRYNKTLRVTSGTIQALSSASDYAGRVLGFNAAGVPIPVNNPGDGDASLRADLASGALNLGTSLLAWQLQASGSVKRTLYERVGEVVSAKDFGAKGDAVVGTGGVANATSSIFTDASAAWAASDVGKTISIVGAGTAGGTLIATISGRNSATSITLSTPAITSGTSLKYAYGTDNKNAFQKARDYLENGTGGKIVVPGGKYLITDGIVLGNGTSNASGNTKARVSFEGIPPVGGVGYASPGGCAEIISAYAGSVFTLNGNLGWAIRNLAFTFATNSTAAMVFSSVSVDSGHLEDISVLGCPGAVCMEMTTWGDKNSSFNHWRNVFIHMTGSPANAIGVRLTSPGAGSSDVALNTFEGLHIQPALASHVGLLLGYCDTNTFIRYDCNPLPGFLAAAAAVKFDYSVNTNFPNFNHFFGGSPYTSPIISVGSPGFSAAFNNVWEGWDFGNNSSIPTAAGFVVSRVKLSGDTTFYVNPDAANASGSFGKGDATSFGVYIGRPCLTVSQAYDVLARYFDLNGFTATISLASGTYSAGLAPSKPIVGGRVVVAGQGGGSLFSGAGPIFQANPGIDLEVQSVNLSPASGDGVLADGGVLRVGAGVIFGSAVNHIRADNGGKVLLTGAYFIIGGGTCHLNARHGGSIKGGVSVTLLASVTFSASTARATDAAVLNALGMTFTLGAFTVTGTRYTTGTNGVIDTNGGGANFFPGTVAGSTATGGQYA